MEFKISNIIDKKDGRYLQEAHVNIEVTIELRTFIRTHYKRKRCTNKLISRFVNEGVTYYLEGHPLCKK